MSKNTIDEQADLRVRRTHKLLWEALMAELSTRPFEEITVKEICERAMVHRTTFYKHYADKYALLEEGMQQMYDELVSQVVHAPPKAFSAHHPPPYFVRVFEHVAEHQQFYTLMLCGEGVSRFQKLIKDYIVGQATANVHAWGPNHQQALAPPEMQVHFFAGAVLSLLAWWLENGMPLTPHQMAQYLLSVSGALSSHV